MKIENTAANSMDIEIKAKWHFDKRYTKEAAVSAWNYISLLAHEAAEMYKIRGCNALAAQAEEFAKQIYKELDARGVYKD